MLDQLAKSVLVEGKHSLDKLSIRGLSHWGTTRALCRTNISGTHIGVNKNVLIIIIIIIIE